MCASCFSFRCTLSPGPEQGMGHSEWPMTHVTHWALDPWPMWPMTHGSPGPSPHTSASLTQIYRLPGTIFGHCICTHTFKLLHNCTCKQTAHTGTCKFTMTHVTHPIFMTHLTHDPSTHSLLCPRQPTAAVAPQMRILISTTGSC